MTAATFLHDWLLYFWVIIESKLFLPEFVPVPDLALRLTFQSAF